jgi:hypothetical protein
MKIAGQDVNLPPRDVIVFPRAKGQLIFHLKAVDSFEKYEEFCARPIPPKLFRQGHTEENLEDPTFKSQIQKWLDLRQDWMIMVSLDCPENELTWDTVVATEPATWKNIETELKAAGLSTVEYNRFVAKVYEVNALSERAMETARASFLLMTSLQQSEQFASQADAPNSM